jgi:hypothetical protein
MKNASSTRGSMLVSASAATVKALPPGRTGGSERAVGVPVVQAVDGVAGPEVGDVEAARRHHTGELVAQDARAGAWRAVAGGMGGSPVELGRGDSSGVDPDEHLTGAGSRLPRVLVDEALRIATMETKRLHVRDVHPRRSPPSPD